MSDWADEQAAIIGTEPQYIRVLLDIPTSPAPVGYVIVDAYPEGLCAGGHVYANPVTAQREAEEWTKGHADGATRQVCALVPIEGAAVSEPASSAASAVP